MKHLIKLITGLVATFALLAGCAVIDHSAPTGADKSAAWVLLPFTNATETPFAGQRAEAVTENLLRSLGVINVQRYPSALQRDNLFETGQPGDDAKSLEWAKAQGARYAVSGTVDEWRYKVGVDGEPAVGVALQIVEVDSGRVLWSGVGGKSGWSRESLAGVAQELIKSLLEPALK
ncbi:penicillin-binding protein activator LpoB [Methyloversatilis sp.]|uniref:penicillin-binding protein activator LpoB n=1 Tax=Methyloversatilis sp. TaxID=2569862 RepID=UPI0035AF439F